MPATRATRSTTGASAHQTTAAIPAASTKRVAGSDLPAIIVKRPRLATASGLSRRVKAFDQLADLRCQDINDLRQVISDGPQVNDVSRVTLKQMIEKCQGPFVSISFSWSFRVFFSNTLRRRLISDPQAFTVGINGVIASPVLCALLCWTNSGSWKGLIPFGWLTTIAASLLTN
jgi:hypothetical protein